MKYNHFNIKVFAALSLVFLMTGCKSEKKVTSYNDIYCEQPTTIYIAPVIDNSDRKMVKYPSDMEYNTSLENAKAFLSQTLAQPMINKGYYVIGPLASKQIADSTRLDKKQLRNGDLSAMKSCYGIDAVLVVMIHRWKDANGKWTVALEYLLRSTKTNRDLMHTWVLAIKEVPKNMKGNPVPMKRDQIFADQYSFDNMSAQRCFIVEKVNDYVLRDLPINVQMRQFEDDLYRNANPTYIKYIWTEEGGADVRTCSIEEYEDVAFM